MEEQQPKSKLVKWLDKLQQMSWELELLISGFSIFLLIGLIEQLDKIDIRVNLVAQGGGEMGTLATVTFAIVIGATFFLLLNLVVHVILRGVWISAIGLRYVSADIDFDSFRFTEKFDRFLRHRTGSFDNYIQILEKLCSILFAFTFLIVFMLVAFGMNVLAMMAIGNAIEYVSDDLLSLKFKDEILVAFVILYLSAGGLYLLDFVTLGWLKRKKRLAGFYFPVYRFFSFVSLSRLYRPIYYNLVDNPFGRRLGYFLVPYVVLVIFLLSMEIKTYVWFPKENDKLVLDIDFYDDQRKQDETVPNVSLPSRFVKNGFLEVFIRYRANLDDKALAKHCPGFKTPQETGLRFNAISLRDEDKREHLADTLLACFKKRYEIRVDDSLFAEPTFYFFKHPNIGEPGLKTMLDISYLPRGEHRLEVKKRGFVQTKDDRDSAVVRDFAFVPFWKE